MQQPYSWNGITHMPPSVQDWSGWAQRLHQTEQQLQRMNEQLAGLQKKLDEIQNKPPFHIEYHFDQLKVNRLEGTLNVGLSPQGIQGIESFEAPDPASWKVTSDQPEVMETPIHDLQNEMNAYMNDNSANMLMAMERQYGVSLEEDHRQRVLDDVRKQLNDRVHYYARTAPYPSKGTDEELQKWSDTIKEKTKRDIQGALSAYLSKLKQQPPQRSTEAPCHHP
ncbi:spore germination protein GerPC [Cohnella sp.]|uniref:spore germination protein GerPC n=1 Tax=Cohnella sp. TaxID=1883426 RepID=UPI00356A0FB8